MRRLKVDLEKYGVSGVCGNRKASPVIYSHSGLARMLGRDGMGSYTVILTFTGLFELIATFGVGTMIRRAIRGRTGTILVLCQRCYRSRCG
jgi:hypothetical protein